MITQLFNTRLRLFSVLLGATTLMPGPALALNFSCSATMSALNFGNVDFVMGTGLNATASLTYTCKNTGVLLTRNARVCFNIGDGAQGTGFYDPRVLRSGTSSPLYFQMYQSPGLIWGSSANGTIPVPFEIVLQNVLPQGTRSGTVSLIGQITPGQTAVAPGTYQNQFTGGHTKISLVESSVGTPANCGVANDGSFPFTVTATVPKSCKVSATDLNFGTVPNPVTASNIVSQSTVTVTCSAGTPYTVALRPSNNATNGVGQMLPSGTLPGNTDKVPYQLYRNAARTSPWGAQTGVNTAAGTGTGAGQAYTVYGRVPTTNFFADSYRDTVTVSVTY